MQGKLHAPGMGQRRVWCRLLTLQESVQTLMMKVASFKRPHQMAAQRPHLIPSTPFGFPVRSGSVLQAGVGATGVRSPGLACQRCPGCHLLSPPSYPAFPGPALLRAARGLGRRREVLASTIPPLQPPRRRRNGGARSGSLTSSGATVPLEASVAPAPSAGGGRAAGLLSNGLATLISEVRGTCGCGIAPKALSRASCVHTQVPPCLSSGTSPL